MEALRADLLRNFEAKILFSDNTQEAHLLVPGLHDYSSAEWKLYTGSKILEQVKLQMTRGESVLVRVPRIKPNLSLDFKRRLFMEIFNTLQLDHGALRPLSSIESTFCWTYKSKVETFYVRVETDIFIWNFDSASETTRGLLIPCATESELGSKVGSNFALLKQPLGLLWQCFVFGIESMKNINDRCWHVLQTIEEGTGYGKSRRPQHASDPDIFTEWSREVARVAVEIAIARRDFENLCRMYQVLISMDHSSQPLFEEGDALSIARGYLDHENVKAKYLADRMHNQMSVLFNLIARADTQASIELTKISKGLTEANLAVARAAKDDSGAMKTISVMTMLFLPATFFAALFSMPTLQWNESQVVGNRFWIYWAFTIPVTMMIFLVCTASRYRDPAKYAIALEHSIGRIHNHQKLSLRHLKRKLQSDANVECG